MKFEDMINNVILGDCYEVIKNIPDKSIDCIYVDVPYLMPNTRGDSGGFMSGRISNFYNNQVNEFKEGFDLSILDEFVRISKNINIFIWCNKFLIKDLLNYFIDKIGIQKYEILTWNKENPIPMTNNVWLSDIEYCLYFNKNSKLNDGYDLKSKWYVSPINKCDKDKFNHPTIKPLELVERHIKHATQKNDIILDCFCGSGTTCVACKNTNRRYIGIELNPKWHKVAVDRLNNIDANGQMSLFTM